MECEFADPDFLTAMLTPQTKTEEIQRLEQALLQIPPKAPILTAPPPLPRPRRVLSIRRAMLARQREIPVDKALGRILASAHVGCPPCIPILACGERIDQAAIRCVSTAHLSAVLTSQAATRTALLSMSTQKLLSTTTQATQLASAQ